MKHYKLKAILASFFILYTTGVGAQNLNSSYFMEGMTYRHQLNPAFMGESNYINMPLFVLGNFMSASREISALTISFINTIRMDIS